MKKNLLLLILFFIPIFVYADTCNNNDIVIKEISKIDANGYIEEKSEPIINNQFISTDLKMYDVKDSITYEIKIKNNSSQDYSLNKNISNSNNVNYSIISDSNIIKANEEKTIKLKITYTKKIDDSLYENGKYIENKDISLLIENGLINPNTGLSKIIVVFIIIFFILLSSLIIKRDVKYMSLLVVLFIPLLVNAECKYQIMINSTIEFKNKIPNPCMYDPSTYDDSPAIIFGRIDDVNKIEIRDRANYVNGQYTYTYHKAGSEEYTVDGWSVRLTDTESTDPVTTKICTSVNGRPIIDMSSMFYGSNATSIDLSNFDTSNVTNMTYMFSNSKATTLDLSSFDTSNVTNMSGMFINAQTTTLDLSSFDTSNVTNMSNMFDGSQATSIDLSSFDTSNVIYMNSMFAFSQTPRLDLSRFDTSKVTNMYWMFADSQVATLDLSSFDTRNVTDMSYMFADSQATTLDLSSFDTSKVTNMSWMFEESQATSLDLSSFDTRNVTDMSYMFSKSYATTLDLSSFDTSNVINMRGMFYNAIATTGYARTQTDADRLNATSNKPSGLTFVVKGS